MMPAAMKPALVKPAAMKPAPWPRGEASATRLLYLDLDTALDPGLEPGLDPAGRRRAAGAARQRPVVATSTGSERRAFVDGRIGDLRDLLREGDLLVVNDAATLPASLRGVTGSGVPVEVRLAGAGDCGGDGNGGGDGGGDDCWRAALFGAGDWRQRTEDRPPPPAVGIGEELRFGGTGAGGRRDRRRRWTTIRRRA